MVKRSCSGLYSRPVKDLSWWTDLGWTLLFEKAIYKLRSILGDIRGWYWGEQFPHGESSLWARYSAKEFAWVSQSILKKTPWGRHEYFSHFTGKESESQRRQITCPKSHSKAWIWMELAFSSCIQNHGTVSPLRKLLMLFCVCCLALLWWVTSGTNGKSLSSVLCTAR